MLKNREKNIHFCSFCGRNEGYLAKMNNFKNVFLKMLKREQGDFRHFWFLTVFFCEMSSFLAVIIRGKCMFFNSVKLFKEYIIRGETCFFSWKCCVFYDLGVINVGQKDDFGHFKMFINAKLLGTYTRKCMINCLLRAKISAQLNRNRQNFTQINEHHLKKLDFVAKAVEMKSGNQGCFWFLMTLRRSWESKTVKF